LDLTFADFLYLKLRVNRPSVVKLHKQIKPQNPLTASDSSEFRHRRSSLAADNTITQCGTLHRLVFPACSVLRVRYAVTLL